ncbi:hypothetical protein V5799_005012 [Amblyomma americanum]|uniref:Organic cation/carnitine transporter n=1 Tax=Amblyomma americanum TaxID=6943 RepID=A0AAQ4D4G5_AMBAM
MLLLSRKKLSRNDLVSSDCYDCGDVYGHGHFQRWFCILATLSVCAQQCHTLVFRLISGDVDHWCKQPHGVVMMSADAWKNTAIPLEADGRLSRCTFYKYPSDPNDTQVVDCDEWDYDSEKARRTIVSRWNLVCRRRPLRALAQAVYIAGSLVFMSAVGHIADQIGRLPVLLSAVAVLQLTTLGGCFAQSYIMYILSRFFNAGCAATVGVLSCTLLFEVSTHENRNRHVCAALTAGLLMAEVWLAVARLLRKVDWTLLQGLMLAPTVLTLYAFAAVHESARWCVAEGNMVKAEIIMISAAKENLFPIPTTACMLERLKEEVARVSKRVTSTAKDISEAKELQRRAFVMFGSSFTVSFTMFSILMYEAKVASGASAWYPWASSAMNLVGFGLLYAAFRKIAAARLLSTVVAGLGCMAFLISLSFVVQYEPLTTALFLSAKPFVYAVSILIYISVLGMVPTTVRCSTACWFFGFGRLGGVCAVLLSILQDAGREDVLFALAGTALFVMLVAHVSIRSASEQPTISSPLSTTGNVDTMGYMKQTLDPLTLKKEKSEKRKKSRARASSMKAQSTEPKPNNDAID